MNPNQLLRIAAIVSSLTTHHLNAQERLHTLTPVRPPELLKCLPSAEKTWKLTVSKAAHLRDVVPMTKAERVYIQVQESQNGAPPATTMLHMTLLDTGGDPALLNLYTQSDSGSSGLGNRERFTIGSYPAFRMRLEDGSERIEALVLNRFLIVATLKGSLLEKPDKWLNNIDYVALRNAAARSTKLDLTKQVEIILERVDEIDPKRSKTTKSYIGGHEEAGSVP